MNTHKRYHQIYNATYYAKNRERILAVKKDWYKNNREKHCKAARLRRQQNPERNLEIKRNHVRKHAAFYRRKNSRRMAELRSQAIFVLGERCVACGYDNDIRAIQIDHINGDGKTERKTLNNYSIYRSIVKFGHQNKYQALCANCNVIKQRDKGEHRRFLQ